MSNQLFIGTTTAPVDPYLLALRTTLGTTFKASPVIAATDDVSVGKNASIMSMYTNVVVAFQMHVRKEVIRRMISDVDVSDDADLTALQNQLLGLAEWTTDTSDAPV